MVACPFDLGPPRAALLRRIPKCSRTRLACCFGGRASIPSQSRLKGDGGCFGGDGGSTERLGSTTGGFGLQNFRMHSMAPNVRNLQAGRGQNTVGHGADSCSASARLRAAKGGEKPAAPTPQRGLAGWRRPENRAAAGRLLVALGPVQVLFSCAKKLSVAAIHGWGSPGLAPNRQIGT